MSLVILKIGGSIWQEDFQEIWSLARTFQEQALEIQIPPTSWSEGLNFFFFYNKLSRWISYISLIYNLYQDTSEDTVHIFRCHVAIEVWYSSPILIYCISSNNTILAAPQYLSAFLIGWKKIVRYSSIFYGVYGIVGTRLSLREHHVLLFL